MFNPASPPAVDSVAHLRKIVGDPVTLPNVILSGYYAAQDGLASPFPYVWDASDSTADNGGTVIKPTSVVGNGRWLLSQTNSLHASWFGVETGTATDQTTLLQNAFNATMVAGGELTYPTGTIWLTGRSSLGQISSVDSVTLNFPGTKFKYDPADPVPTVGTVWSMFSFTNVATITTTGSVEVESNLTEAEIKASTSIRGARFMYIYGNTKNLTLCKLKITGGCIGYQTDNAPTIGFNTIAYIGDGGTGYTVNDVLTVSGGGVGSTAATLTVNTVNAGVITAATITTPGSYVFTTLPAVGGAVAGVSVTGGTGTGAKFNMTTKCLDATQLCENITIGGVLGTNTCYLGQIGYGAKGVDLGYNVADHCYRAWVVIGGVDNVKGTMVIGDTVSDALALGVGYGLGGDNWDFDVTVLPPQTANYSLNRSIIRLGFNNNGYPGTFTNLNFNTVSNWGTTAGRGGSLFIFDRDDSTGRGNILRNCNIILNNNGTPDQDSGTVQYLIGMDVNYTWPSTDYFSGINISGTSTGGAHIFLIPGPLSGINSLNLYSDGLVNYNNPVSGSAYLTARGNLYPGNSVFSNRYVTASGNVPTIGTIISDAAVTIPLGWQTYYIYPGAGTGATRVYTLPAATPGLNYTFGAGGTTASSFVRLEPNGSEVIRGGGAGKYMELGSLGAQASLRCDIAGTWEVVSSSGTTSFEP